MKYFLAQDQSCHWYLVDASKKKEWEEWLNLDSDDERSWEEPDCAEAVQHPEYIIFENPVNTLYE